MNRLLKTKKVIYQRARLQHLENNHPGISVIHRDVMGTILLDETDLGLDGLIKEMRAEADAE